MFDRWSARAAARNRRRPADRPAEDLKYGDKAALHKVWGRSQFAPVPGPGTIGPKIGADSEGGMKDIDDDPAIMGRERRGSSNASVGSDCYIADEEVS